MQIWNINTNLLDFIAEQEDTLPVKKMTGNFMLEPFVVYDMRNFSHCTELVLDRIAFGDEDGDFAHAIEEFLTMYNVRITVICEGLEESDPLCRALLDAGVSNITTSVEIREMQEEIRQSLNRRGMTRFSPREREQPKTLGEHYRFIADGVRIAIIPYLKDAYEMDEEVGGFCLDKMWYGVQPPGAGFHFLIEDHGTGRPGTNADILLLVCGTKPYELMHTMRLLEEYGTRAALVLLCFRDCSKDYLILDDL